MKKYSLLLSFVLSINFLSAQEVTALGKVEGAIEVEYENVTSSVTDTEVEYEEVRSVAADKEIEYERVTNKKVTAVKAKTKKKAIKKVQKEEVKKAKKVEVKKPKTKTKYRKTGKARKKISGSITSQKEVIGKVESNLKKAEDKFDAKKNKLSVKNKIKSKLEISELKAELRRENEKLTQLKQEFKKNL